jgi:hypothetical protein
VSTWCPSAVAATRCSGLLLSLLIAAGCTRSAATLELIAAFSDDTAVGELNATWRDTGEERPGSAPNTRERKVIFRVDAVNRLSDPLYLGLRDLRLLGPAGALAVPGAVACALAPGTTPGLLSGAVWVPARDAPGIHGFEISRFAVPLSERGRAFYREFLLRQRPGAAAAIDEEMAAYAAAAPCRAAN